MVVCYLDDSGEELEPIVTLAGAVGTSRGWQEFEVDARRLFDAAGIDHLHTVDLHHRRRQFRNWSSIETKCFAHALFRLVEHHAGFLVEFSVLKERFRDRKAELNLKRETSPISMCFRGVLDLIVCDEGFLALEEQCRCELSFVVEGGHKNQNDILQRFNAVKKMDPVRFGAIRFTKKSDAIALQVADFVAFYSRRIRNQTVVNRRADLEIFQGVIGNIKRRAFFAQDFGI